MQKSGRRLHDMQAMDTASRGPLGALSILPRRIGGGVAISCCAITISLIVFSPFLQQLVEYPTRSVVQPGLVALASQNLAYPSYFQAAHRGLDKAIEAGIWSAPRPFDQEPACPTGQCLWSNFKSVGWCNQCENKTSLVELKNCTLETVLRNKTDLSQLCVIDLGEGVKTSFLTDTPLAIGDNTIVVRSNYTAESIWQVNRAGDAPPMPTTSGRSTQRDALKS